MKLKMQSPPPLSRPKPSLAKELWSVRQTLKGKNIMIIGSTGFLGRVMFYMLLKFVPEIKTIYLLIRPTHSRNAKERFQKELLRSPVFTQNEGDFEFFSQNSAQKVECIEGDASKPMLGIPEDERPQLQSKLDLVLNTAGNVEFNPPLDLSLDANTIATREVLAFTAKTAGRKYAHISTCYVAEISAGQDSLSEEHIDPQIRRDDGSSVAIDPHAHIKDSLDQVRAIQESYQKEKEKLRADSNSILKAKLEKEVLLELERLGQDRPSPHRLEKMLRNFHSKKMREELVALGVRRAKAIKRPNVYTYAKTLAELLVQSYASELESVIVRPSIVETALRYPFPGWNEGIQGTAPLVYLAYTGHRMFPALTKENGKYKSALLDCIPVDEVANGTILAMCALMQGKHKAVYQLAAGQQKSPLSVNTFAYIANNMREENARNGKGLLPWMQRNIQPYVVHDKAFERFSSPRALRILSKMRKGMDSFSASAIEENLPESSQKLKQKLRLNLERFYQISQVKNKIFQEFFPFIHKGYPPFLNKNAKELHAALLPEEKEIFHFNPSQIDYLDYASGLHAKALQKWIFPILKKRFKSLEKIGKTGGTRETKNTNDSKQKLREETKRKARPKIKAFKVFLGDSWRTALEISKHIEKKSLERFNPSVTGLAPSAILKPSLQNKQNKAEAKPAKAENSPLLTLGVQLEKLASENENFKSLQKASLGYLEKLSEHLEFIYGARISTQTLRELNSLSRLHKHIQAWLSSQESAANGNEISTRRQKLFPQEGRLLPGGLRDPSSDLLYSMQMWFYRRLMRPQITGSKHIPRNNNHVIIVANHSSHLDYGLVWYCLGKYGRNMGIVAAKDYFFDRFWKSTFFANFLNLIPIERENKNNYAKTLTPILDFLKYKGAPLLIFPEGTRSSKGEIRNFRLGLGYLIRHSQADVLPIRIYNSHNALPKGKFLVRLNQGEPIRINIGALITNESLAAKTQGFSPTKTYHYLTQEIFESIRDMA